MFLWDLIMLLGEEEKVEELLEKASGLKSFRERARR